jgi:H-type lectin domain
LEQVCLSEFDVPTEDRQRKNPRHKAQQAAVTGKKKQTPTTKKSNSTRLVIAIIGIIGSIGVAFVKGYFDRVHIDSRLDNLRGVQIDVGNWSAGNTNAGWQLDKPTGSPDAPPRKFTIPIHFTKVFTYEPKVFVSVKLIDASNSANFRWAANIDNVTKDGFFLVLETDSDSIVYWLAGDYIAFQQ